MTDAVALLEQGRYSTAAGIALLAREELGRHKTLLGLWRESIAGTRVTRERVNSSCDDHVEKQRSAQLSLTYRLEGSGQVAEILRTRHRSLIGSDEWRSAGEKLRLLDERRLKRQPSDRHAKRMSAFYVDLADDDSWSRPCQLEPPDCAGEVVDALNDYAGARERIQQAGPLHNDQNLATAIEALSHPTTLPPTPWPSLAAMMPASTKAP